MFWDAGGDGCDPVGPNGRVIDENDGCYIRGGDPQYWRRVDNGHDGGQDWTYTIAGSGNSNYGIWRLDFDQAGTYRVEVYLDGITGESRQAPYEVAHNDQINVVSIDQSAGGGWVVLGDFEFAAGGRQHVLLGDNTGEANANEVQLAFDAVRVTPADGATVEIGDGGCGCRAGGQPKTNLALYALLALLALGRRRRRR